MMDFSRGSHGKLRLQMDSIDMRTIVADAIATVRPHFAARGHHLAVALPPEPLLFVADSSKLHQVLTNLLNNASKFTDPGGHICLTAETPTDGVVIRVRDNGRGISPDLLPRIFEPFHQSDDQRGREQAGLGLGLSIAKSLVELHGGSIAAHSEGSNSGAEFVVRLPVGDCGLCHGAAKQN
jgi:signal transduction histidine kinase